MYIVEYEGFLQHIRREFPTLERAEQWCRQIGRNDLIRLITHNPL